MTIPRIVTNSLAALALLTAICCAYALWARPFQLQLGATPQEVGRAMPGDELRKQPTFLATRAITVDGTPEEIWPWLIQMGYGRAGFYGYDLLENLGSDRGPWSADRILPEFQQFGVGDEVPISAIATMHFYAIEPPRHIVWSGEPGVSPGGFSWELYPIDAGHTRLLSRIGWTHHWDKPSLLMLDVFTEFTDHLAVREILLGVKGRVEGRTKPPAMQVMELAVYVFAFLVFAIAVALLVLTPLTHTKWLAAFCAGVLWLVCWYAPIPIWTSAVLGLIGAAAVWRVFRRRASALGQPRRF